MNGINGCNSTRKACVTSLSSSWNRKLAADRVVCRHSYLFSCGFALYITKTKKHHCDFPGWISVWAARMTVIPLSCLCCLVPVVLIRFIGGWYMLPSSWGKKCSHVCVFLSQYCWGKTLFCCAFWNLDKKQLFFSLKISVLKLIDTYVAH